MEALTLEEILVFCTGIDRIPIGGFHTKPAIKFSNNNEVLATASTCELVLRLPTIHANDPVKFEEKFILSPKGHIGFGTV